MAVTNRRSIVVNENYHDGYLTHDIALVELPQDAPIDHDYVATLQLPSGADRTRNFVGVRATASGFGRYYLTSIAWL